MLRLSVVDKTVESGRVKQVVLAVDFVPTDDTPRPRMVDLRLVSNRAIELLSAESGDALTQANKTLFLDPVSNQPWRKRADGSYQLLVFTTENTNRLAPGRIVTIAATLDSENATFALKQREQILAPPEADAAIQSTPYQTPVVVVPASVAQ